MKSKAVLLLSLPFYTGPIVGFVDQQGPKASKHAEGLRVGIGWIGSSCGKCRYCLRGLENLCPDFKATGRDLPGGYAQYVIVDQDFAFPIPSVYSDLRVAPLLCAGAIGWRSLRLLAGLRDGESPGTDRFCASAHLAPTLARHLYPRSEIFVFCAFRTESENLLWSWVPPGPAIQPTRVRAIACRGH